MTTDKIPSTMLATASPTLFCCGGWEELIGWPGGI
jgi:hypothetical protein